MGRIGKRRGFGRKKKMDTLQQLMLRAQLEAFRKKFGRDPGPGDPVFFDPNIVPTPIDQADASRCDGRGQPAA
jgi:hypothetical protein